MCAWISSTGKRCTRIDRTGNRMSGPIAPACVAAERRDSECMRSSAAWFTVICIFEGTLKRSGRKADVIIKEFTQNIEKSSLLRCRLPFADETLIGYLHFVFFLCRSKSLFDRSNDDFHRRENWLFIAIERKLFSLLVDCRRTGRAVPWVREPFARPSTAPVQ